jgi:hypothetical protein
LPKFLGRLERVLVIGSLQAESQLFYHTTNLFSDSTHEYMNCRYYSNLSVLIWKINLENYNIQVSNECGIYKTYKVAKVKGSSPVLN